MRPTRALRAGLLQVAGVLVLLGGWQLVTKVGLVSPSDLPTMSAAARSLGHEVADGAIWPLVKATVGTWAFGLGIVVLGGVALGLVIGAIRPLSLALGGVIEFLRPVPAVAVIPLAVVLLGDGQVSAVFLVVTGALWPVLIQTIAGVRALDAVSLETASVFGLSRASVYRFVRLPGAVPFIMTGVRLSSAIALILAVTAELIIGSPGLGQAIGVAEQGANLPLMYGLIVASGILGYLLNVLMELVGTALTPWNRVRGALVL